MLKCCARSVACGAAWCIYALQVYLSVTDICDLKKQKGVLDHSFISVKVPLHKESTHDEVLLKCIGQVIEN